MKKRTNMRTRILSLAAAAMITAGSLFTGGDALAANAKTIKVGSSVNLTVKKAAKWSTSNKKVAKLTKISSVKYKVTAMKVGTAKVTAKAGTTSYTCKINVKAASISSAASGSSGTESIQSTAIAGSTDAKYTVQLASGTKTVIGHFDESIANSCVSELNAYRSEHGLNTLKVNKNLVTAAKIRAYESTVKFEHTRPNGTSCFTVSSLAYGENLAYGFSSASKVTVAWSNSASHNANMLRDGYQTVGIACFCARQSNGSYVNYFVQMFGK